MPNRLHDVQGVFCDAAACVVISQNATRLTHSTALNLAAAIRQSAQAHADLLAIAGTIAKRAATTNRAEIERDMEEARHKAVASAGELANEIMNAAEPFRPRANPLLVTPLLADPDEYDQWRDDHPDDPANGYGRRAA